MSQQRAGDTSLLSQFAQGNVVILQSLCAGGQNLTVVDGEVVGQKGREDSQAQFRVHVHRPGVITLQSVYNPDWWLAIYDGKPVGSGCGSPYCEFMVREIDGKVVALESVMYPGCNLGVEPDGSGTDTHCLFVPYLCSVAYTPPPPPIDTRLRNPSLSELYQQPSAPFAPQFRTLPQPNRYPDLLLQPLPGYSNPRPPTSPKPHRLSYLEQHYPPPAIQPYNTTSTPPQAQNAIASIPPQTQNDMASIPPQQHTLSHQYYPTSPYYPSSTLPHPHLQHPHPGATAQSQEPDHGLLRETWYHGGLSKEGAKKLLEKTTNGHFLVRESEIMTDGVYTLSLKHPGGVRHFRIHRNRFGLYEIPGNPGFQTIPELISYFTQHSITAEMNQRLHFPLPRLSAAHKDDDKPTPHRATLPRKVAPPAPENQPTAAPLGYNILDLFQPGNILHLIPRADPSNLPIWVGSKKLHGKGTYHSSNSEFQVAVPSYGAVLLKNVKSPNCHLCIDKKGRIRADGKDGDDKCYFTVLMAEDGNSVLLESHKFPRWYIAVGIGGEVVDPKTLVPGSREAHFGVRAEKVVNPHSAELTTPFGGYSIANHLKDRCIIQLFCKRVGGYLSINKKGSVEECRDENDQQTFFILHDHGMGIFSLHSYKYPGHLIRMHENTLEGKGDADMSADFHLKETPNGAACFESITYPGMCISISTIAQIQGCHFSISRLTIQRRGKVETIIKTPVNNKQ